MRGIEDNLQKNVFTYFSLQYPHKKGLFFHCPNGGKRNAKEAAKLKGMGVLPGVPDLLLIHNKTLYGIELKAEKGKVSEHQNNINNIWRSNGINTYICYGFDDAIKTLNDIMHGRNMETCSNKGIF